MSRYVDNLNIKAFRGIRDLVLDDLGDLNILVGDNNCGKTSVLESLMTLSNPNDFNNIIKVSRMRDGLYRIGPRYGPNFLDSFIHMFDPRTDPMWLSISGSISRRKVSVELTGTIGNMLIDLEELSKQSSMWRQRIQEGYIIEGEEIPGFNGKLSFYIEGNQLSLLEEEPNVEYVYFHKYVRNIGLNKTKPVIKMNFISTIDHITDSSFRYITKDQSITNEVVKILNIFDPDIINLKIVEEDYNRYVQTIEHRHLGTMPLSTYGDGIKKIIALANGVAGAKGGVLLIDEIETSIHKKAMKRVFSWLIEACRTFNVQLFLTTHSMEAVDEILLSDSEVTDNFRVRVITLVKKEEKTIARILTGEKARQARDDYDTELR